jgi:hypothetical protein
MESCGRFVTSTNAGLITANSRTAENQSWPGYPIHFEKSQMQRIAIANAPFKQKINELFGIHPSSDLAHRKGTRIRRYGHQRPFRCRPSSSRQRAIRHPAPQGLAIGRDPGIAVSFLLLSEAQKLSQNVASNRRRAGELKANECFISSKSASTSNILRLAESMPRAEHTL